MKTTLLIAASALTLAGCQGASNSVAKLDCPATEGDLTRVSISDDGKTCAYQSADGAEVSLELVPVVGDAQSTLSALYSKLKTTSLAFSFIYFEFIYVKVIFQWSY